MPMIFPRSILYPVLVFFLSGIGWTAHHYYHQTIFWRERMQVADERINQQVMMLDELRRQQQILAELDSRLTEELRDEVNENTFLHHQLATGARRLHVTGRCATSQKDSAATGSMGDGETIEVAGNTGQDILHLRESIIRDRKKLIYLQEYVMTSCH